jgi:hypothetical protein
MDRHGHVRESAAWALWQLSRYQHDIGLAVPELVSILVSKDEYKKPRQNAAGALLHHAQKSATSLAGVRSAVKAVSFEDGRGEIKRFKTQLAML